MSGRTVGFVGFGAMPRLMAARLRSASHATLAFDPGFDGDAVDGVRLIDRPAVLARRVDAVVICVPDDAALEKVRTGPDGLLAGASPGSAIVNCSTVSPGASRAFAAAATAAGARYVEAPMSGSTPEAESGDLVFLAGGSADDVAAAAWLLDALGRKTVRVGDVGDGAVMKLIVNGVMALGTAALAEGLAYGDRAGLDRAVAIDVLSDLILVSEHHKRKLAMAKTGKFPAQFPTRLMSKDMGLLLADASAHGASMPAMAAAADLYADAARDRADDDYASVIAAAEDAGTLSGVSPRRC